jgi:hypothetical protein
MVFRVPAAFENPRDFFCGGSLIIWKLSLTGKTSDNYKLYPPSLIREWLLWLLPVFVEVAQPTQRSLKQRLADHALNG